MSAIIWTLTSVHIHFYIQYVILFLNKALIEQDEARSIIFFNSLIFIVIGIHVKLFDLKIVFRCKIVYLFMPSKSSHMKKQCQVICPQNIILYFKYCLLLLLRFTTNFMIPLHLIFSLQCISVKNIKLETFFFWLKNCSH